LKMFTKSMIENFIKNSENEHQVFVQSSKLRNKKLVHVPWRVEHGKLLIEHGLQIDAACERFSTVVVKNKKYNRLAILKEQAIAYYKLRNEEDEVEASKDTKSLKSIHETFANAAVPFYLANCIGSIDRVESLTDETIKDEKHAKILLALLSELELERCVSVAMTKYVKKSNFTNLFDAIEHSDEKMAAFKKALNSFKSEYSALIKGTVFTLEKELET